MAESVNKPSWYAAIESKFGEKILGLRESAPGELEITVAAETAPDILAALKDENGPGFSHLSDLTAYDDVPQSPRFKVVYELISMALKQRCCVLAGCADDKSPQIPTVTSLWRGANWLEREVYDMYGINFLGHPDMRRILMPQVFKGNPLRKDFVWDYRQEFEEKAASDIMFDPFGNTIIEGAVDGATDQVTDQATDEGADK